MVYFVRHGESESNRQHVFAGQRVDSPETPLGRQQDRAAGDDIKRRGLLIDRIVSSPLKRAAETARIIARQIGFDAAKIEYDERASEYDMGSLSGKSMPSSPVEPTTPPDAEDIHEFQRRVIGFINELSQLPGNSLVVSHAEVGRMIEATARHDLPHLFRDLDGFPHGRVTQLEAPYSLTD